MPALILLPFFLLKPNRRAGAWLVMVPLGLIAAVLLAGQQIPSTSLVYVLTYMYPYVAMLASSLCILCLMTFVLPAWSLTRKILTIPALSILPAALILCWAEGVSEAREQAMLAAYVLGVLSLMASFALAGRRSRKRWSLRRFSLLTFAWNLILVFAAVLVSLGITFMIQPPSTNVLAPLGLAVLAVATFLYIIAFPFILTAFLSPFYRDRLKAAFKVFPASQPEQTNSGCRPDAPDLVS